MKVPSLGGGLRCLRIRHGTNVKGPVDTPHDLGAAQLGAATRPQLQPYQDSANLKRALATVQAFKPITTQVYHR